MMNCSEVMELISLYIDNELDDEMRKNFEEHVNTCESCREELDETASIVRLCNSIEEEELPEGFGIELHKKLVEINSEINQKEDKRKSLVFLRNKYLKICSSIAAVLLMTVIIRGFWGNLNHVGFNQGTKSADMSSLKTESANLDAYEKSSEAQHDNKAAKYEVKADEENEMIAFSMAPEAQEDEPVMGIMGSNEESGTAKTSSRGIEVHSGISANAGDVSAAHIYGNAGRSNNVEIKTLSIEDTANKIKQIAEKNGAQLAMNINTTLMNADTEKKEDKDIVMNFTVENSKYEQFITALKNNTGASTIDIGAISTQNAGDLINDFSKRLDAINIEINSLENDKERNSDELKRLKEEKDVVAADIERIRKEAEYTLVMIRVTNK